MISYCMVQELLFQEYERGDSSENTPGSPRDPAMSLSSQKLGVVAKSIEIHRNFSQILPRMPQVSNSSKRAIDKTPTPKLYTTRQYTS